MEENRVRMLLEVSIEQLKKDWVDSGKISAATFDKVCQVANNKSNWATWLVKKVSDQIIKESDLDQWRNYIATFERYKVRFQVKDINQLKTPEQVEAFASECTRIQNEADARVAASGGEKVRGSKEERKYEVDKFRMPDFVNSFSGKKFSVYKIPRDTPENKKYAIELGTGTTWCTASRGDRNLYSRYNDQGPLYIFINKEDPADKYQIHLETENFMDKNDRSVNFNSLEYIEFYDYLINKQHEAQIVPDNIEKLLKCFEIIKKAKQYPANPDKFLIPEHVEPEDKWYLIKCETEEDVIKNFNTLNQFVGKSDESRALTVDVPGIEDLVKSKSWYVIRELNGKYTWYYVIQKSRSDSVVTSWKMCIRSKEDFEKVEHFLKLYDFFEIFRKYSLAFREIIIKYGDVRDELSNFEIGEYEGHPIYYFQNRGGYIEHFVHEYLVGYRTPRSIRSDIVYCVEPKVKYIGFTSDLFGYIKDVELWDESTLNTVSGILKIVSDVLPVEYLKEATRAAILYKKLAPAFIKFIEESETKLLPFPVELARNMYKCNDVFYNNPDYKLRFDQEFEYGNMLQPIFSMNGLKPIKTLENYCVMKPEKQSLLFLHKTGELSRWYLSNKATPMEAFPCARIDRVSESAYVKWGKRVLEAFREAKPEGFEEPGLLVAAEKAYERKELAESLKGTGYSKLVLEYYI